MRRRSASHTPPRGSGIFVDVEQASPEDGPHRRSEDCPRGAQTANACRTLGSYRLEWMVEECIDSPGEAPAEHAEDDREHAEVGALEAAADGHSHDDRLPREKCGSA